MYVSSIDPTSAAPLTRRGREAVASPAAARRARDSLRAAAVACDRAGACGREVDDGLDLHAALVAGRWVVVDSFEAGGKRYLIARENTPAPIAASELSARETQVLVFAARGHALKLIAYELGVSESSVATYLRRALAKLGLPDRIALTRRFAGFRYSRGAAATRAEAGA